MIAFIANRVRWAGLALGLGALSGCGNLQSVPVRDDDSPSYALRATIRPPAWQRNEGFAHGIEFGYEGYRARDTQVLAPGDSIGLENGGSIVGPDTLRHQATLRQLHVAYAPLIRFGSGFELEPFVGAARIQLKMESQPANAATLPMLNETRTSVYGGITPRWRFNDWLAVEARLAYSRTGIRAHGQSYEAAVVLSPSPTVALRLGYSERRYDIEPVFEDWFSEVNIRARGPLATLQFSF